MNEENATTWTAEDIAIRKSLSARGTCRDPLGRWVDGDNADYRAMLDYAKQAAQYGEKFATHLVRLEAVRS